jgi:hypothetical protein
MVEKESENRKMEKELAGPVGKGQEAVVEEKSYCEISLKMDFQVLDCNICFEPLKPPIFQVINRNIIASTHIIYLLFLLQQYLNLHYCVEASLYFSLALAAQE